MAPGGPVGTAGQIASKEYLTSMPGVDKVSNGLGPFSIQIILHLADLVIPEKNAGGSYLEMVREVQLAIHMTDDDTPRIDSGGFQQANLFERHRSGFGMRRNRSAGPEMRSGGGAKHFFRNRADFIKRGGCLDEAGADAGVVDALDDLPDETLREFLDGYPVDNTAPIPTSRCPRQAPRRVSLLLFACCEYAQDIPESGSKGKVVRDATVR